VVSGRLSIQLALLTYALCVLRSAYAAESPEERRVTSVSRIEIVIDLRAEQVWPYLLDFTRWATDQKVEYLNDQWGKPGGKLRRVTVRDGRVVQDRIEEIIAIEPARRLAVRARPPAPDPSNTDVIANMELSPIEGSHTRFRLDVYLASDLPEPLDAESLQRRKQQMEETLTAALRSRYEQLKAAVEKQP